MTTGNEWNLLLTAVSSGALVWILQALGRTVSKMLKAARDREDAVTRAEREAHEWEIALRRTRRLAVEAGVDPESLPFGPGESPSWRSE